MQSVPCRAGSLVQVRDVGSTDLGSTVALTFDPFDPSLGSLQSVEIGGVATVRADASVYNSTAASQPFVDAASTIPVTLIEPSGQQTTVRGMTLVPGGTALSGTNEYGGTPQVLSFDAITLTGDLLNRFIAGGDQQSVSVTFAVGYGTFTGTAPQGVFFGGGGGASGEVTLEYDYVTAADMPVVPAVAPLWAWAGITTGSVAVVWYRRHRGDAGLKA